MCLFPQAGTLSFFVHATHWPYRRLVALIIWMFLRWSGVRNDSRDVPSLKCDPMPYTLYVIELDPVVRTRKRFMAKNPNARPDKPAVYVGVTV